MEQLRHLGLLALIALGLFFIVGAVTKMVPRRFREHIMAVIGWAAILFGTYHFAELIARATGVQ